MGRWRAPPGEQRAARRWTWLGTLLARRVHSAGAARGVAGAGRPRGPGGARVVHEAPGGPDDERRRACTAIAGAAARRPCSVGLELRAVGGRARRPADRAIWRWRRRTFLLAAARVLAERRSPPARRPPLASLAPGPPDPMAAEVRDAPGPVWAGVGNRWSSRRWSPGTRPASDPGRRRAPASDVVPGNPRSRGPARHRTPPAPPPRPPGSSAWVPPPPGTVGTAALFLLAAVDQVQPGGVLLIQPQSVLASRGAVGRAPVPLADRWPGSGSGGRAVFAALHAGLRACARPPGRPIPAQDTRHARATGIRTVRPASSGPRRGGVLARRRRGAGAALGRSGHPGAPPSWSSIVAAALRNVPVDRPARCASRRYRPPPSAGFRDQFYWPAPSSPRATRAPGEHP